MKRPAWLKPAVIGVVLGGMATLAVGFGEGGWLLSSSAERLANYRSAAAVAKALVPVCIRQSRADPEESLKLEQLSRLETAIARQTFVMETGWATMPLANAPNSDVAVACAEVLNAEG